MFPNIQQDWRLFHTLSSHEASRTFGIVGELSIVGILKKIGRFITGPHGYDNMTLKNNLKLKRL